MICLAASTGEMIGQHGSSLKLRHHHSIYLLIPLGQPVLDIADTRKSRPRLSERLRIVLANPWQAGILLTRGSGFGDEEK